MSESTMTCRQRGTVFLVALVAWAASLASPFWLDDFLQLEWARAALLDPRAIFAGFRFEADDVSPLWLAREDWTVTYARPLVNLIFALEWAAWADWAPGYHGTNLLLHGAVSVLVAVWTDRIRPGAGLVAGLVFAVHPSHQDSVAWISGRTDLVAAVPFMGALIAHHRWRSGEGGRSWVPVALLWVAFCAKETALAFPLVVAGLEWLRVIPGTRPDLRRAVTPSLVVVLLYVAIRMFTGGFGTPDSPYFHSPFAVDFVPIAIQRLALYFANAVFLLPIDPVVSGPILQSNPLIGFAVGMALLVGGWSLWKRSRVGLCAGALLFLAPLLPALPIVESQRFLYLPSAGVAVAVGLGWSAVAPARRGTMLGLVGLVLLLLACSAKTVFRDALVHEVSSPLTTLDISDRSPGARLYFVDVPPLVCMGFGSAVRYWTGRDDVSATALTLSTELPLQVRRWVAEGSEPARTTLERTHTGGLRLRREGGVWFRTYMEKFFLWGRALPTPGEAIRRGSLEGVLLDGGVAAMDFREDEDWTSPEVGVYQWNDRGLHRVDVAKLPIATGSGGDGPPSGDSDR